MNLSDILKTTEDLLYQIILWMLLIPKTLYKVIRQPAWVSEYVENELIKPVDDRFDAFMSPLLFFVLVAVLPNLIANTFWPETPYTDFMTHRGIVEHSGSLNSQHRFLVYGCMWAFLPLSYSLVHQISMGKQITKSCFRPTFYAHCMKVAPASIPFIIRFILVKNLDPLPGPLLAINLGTLVVVFVWLIYSDVALTRKMRNVSRAKAVTLGLLGLVIYYGFIAPVILIENAIK